MITHSITHPSNKNKKVDHQPYWPNANNYGNNRYTQAYHERRMAEQGIKRMEKLEYSKFLDEVGLKAGDFIHPKNFGPPWQDHNIQRVVYVEENHNTVEYSTDGRPRCIVLKRVGMGETWKSCADWMVKVEDLNALPPGWKRVLEAEGKKE